jgi:hypothetical protein
MASSCSWLFLSTGPFGAIESAVGLCQVNSSDLEERQLTNIVAEMAIAGGVPGPRVLLLEGEAVNVGAAGNAPYTVFMARHLLDHLDREETQGVLGHLLASNSQPGPAHRFRRPHCSPDAELVHDTLMDAPFGPRARQAPCGPGALPHNKDERAMPPFEAHRATSKLPLSLQPEGMNDLLAL